MSDKENQQPKDSPDHQPGGGEPEASKGRGKFAQLLSFLVTAPDAPRPATEGDASMSIRLQEGELSGALQFIASSRRSGELELRRAEEAGVVGSIFFSGGTIIHVQHAGGMVGVDAMAALLGEGEMDSRFVAARVPAVSSLSHSADQLLLQATVLADEQQGEGGGARARPSVIQRVRVSGRHVSLLRIGISVASIALLLWLGGSLAPRLWRQWQEERIRKQQIHELAQTRRARGSALLDQAKAAYSHRRYTVAIELCREALDLNKDNAAAKQLLAKAQSSHTAGDARHARGKVRMLQENLDAMQPAQVMPGLNARLQQRKETARKLMALEEYRGATELYELAMSQGKQMLAALENRQQALAKREQAERARKRAESSAAAEAAKPLWTAGMETIRQAEVAFEDNDFAGAETAWGDAAGIFDDAESVARGRRELQAAEQTYTHVLRTLDPELLAEFGGSLWQQVRALRDDVDTLRAEQQFRVAAKRVDQARSLLPKAAEQAEKQRRLKQFETLMTEGERLEALSKWQAAENTYLEALRVPGFEDSAKAGEAKKRMSQRLAEERRQENLARHLRHARASLEKEDWHEVLAETDAALALDPENSEALQLQKNAIAQLPPLLTLRTRLGGEEITAAEIFIDGVRQRRRSPCQFAVEVGRVYRIASRLPAELKDAAGGAMQTWSAKKRGRYTLWIDLDTQVAPQAGKPFAVAGTWMDMRPIPPGRFVRSFGSGESGMCEVRVAKPFWMASIETTRLGRTRILPDMGAPRTNGFLPAVSLNWFEVMRVANELTEREREAGRLPEGYVYRLPTEAEWELACRAGWEGEPRLGETAWYAYNSDGDIHPVAKRLPNRLGLFDILGNASEWCQDWVPTGPNPETAPPEDQRARRGGSARSEPAQCKPQYRVPARDQSRGMVHGFRFVLAPANPGEQYHWLEEKTARKPQSNQAWYLKSLDLTFLPLESGKRPFWAASHETTQAQYEEITGVSAGHFEGASRPVESISWEQASRFCRHLTEREQAANRLPMDMAYRLPTLREWLAIRAAARPPEKPVQADGTHPVHKADGEKAELTGVYDNVQEWCQDWRDREGCGMAPSGRGLHEEACPAAAGGAWFPGGDTNGDNLAIYGSRFAAPFLGFRIVLGSSPEQRSLLCEHNVEGPQWTSHLEGMKMVFVMPGRFEMGRDDGELREGPAHDVLLTRPYWIGTREVTQGQFGRVMERPRQKGRVPVGSVTWNDAMAYCRRLTEAERAKGTLPSGYEYRLPTEAEWEYAAKLADPPGPLSQYAWFEDNSDGQIHPVATRDVDRLGLYDTRGNVWEWCYDWYTAYDEDAERDPWGAVVGSHKVYRGGGAGAPAHMCSPTYRVAMSQYFRNKEVGFRVVLAPVLEPPEKDPPDEQ